MSHEASSRSSNVRERVRVVGVPKRCWCGEEVVPKLSKSESNPCRLYFRCGFDVSKKLMNDNHTFKWIDETLLDEVETLALENERLKQDIKELMTETMKQQKVVFEMVEYALLEAKLEFNSKMKINRNILDLKSMSTSASSSIPSAWSSPSSSQRIKLIGCIVEASIIRDLRFLGFFD